MKTPAIIETSSMKNEAQEEANSSDTATNTAVPFNQLQLSSNDSENISIDNNNLLMNKSTSAVECTEPLTSIDQVKEVMTSEEEKKEEIIILDFKELNSVDSTDEFVPINNIDKTVVGLEISDEEAKQLKHDVRRLSPVLVSLRERTLGEISLTPDNNNSNKHLLDRNISQNNNSNLDKISNSSCNSNQQLEDIINFEESIGNCLLNDNSKLSLEETINQKELMVVLSRVDENNEFKIKNECGEIIKSQQIIKNNSTSVSNNKNNSCCCNNSDNELDNSFDMSSEYSENDGLKINKRLEDEFYQLEQKENPVEVITESKIIEKKREERIESVELELISMATTDSVQNSVTESGVGELEPDKQELKNETQFNSIQIDVDDNLDVDVDVDGLTCDEPSSLTRLTSIIQEPEEDSAESLALNTGAAGDEVRSDGSDSGLGSEIPGDPGIQPAPESDSETSFLDRIPEDILGDKDKGIFTK